MEASYTGRFAPSPTGPLHAGSMAAALASWLDARVHGGRWLIRIEDIDTLRCLPGMDQVILGQLAACGLIPDEAPLYQSQRSALYQRSLDRLMAAGLAYPCACTRQDIAQALAAAGHLKQRHEELVYPGTCRTGLNGRPARGWRYLSVPPEHKRPAAQFAPAQAAINTIANRVVRWTDRRLGAQAQDVSQAVGDFILKRADGPWAYQLAVVVDDAAQGITHVVRGEDLADNTPRQMLLQRALGWPEPSYLHTPLVLAADGNKLSKQNGASAIDSARPLEVLQAAGQVLGLKPASSSSPGSIAAWLAQATLQWRALYLQGPQP